LRGFSWSFLGLTAGNAAASAGISRTLPPENPQVKRRGGEGAYNRHVMQRSISRTVLALVLAPSVMFSAVVAPPAHVHEAAADHPHAVAHRHFEAHDHDGADVSQNEGQVLWLDDQVIQPATYPFPVALAVLPLEGGQKLEPRIWIPRSTDLSPPLHGPPRLPLSPRGPPSSLPLT